MLSFSHFGAGGGIPSSCEARGIESAIFSSLLKPERENLLIYVRFVA